MLKEIMSILIIIALLLFISSQINWFAVDYKIAGMKESVSNAVKTDSPQCKELVESIMPEKVELTRLVNSYTAMNFWKNGKPGFVIFAKGDKPTQNVNDLYSPLTTQYVDTPISKDGTIGKPINILFGEFHLKILSEKPTNDPNRGIVEAQIVNYFVLKCDVS